MPAEPSHPWAERALRPLPRFGAVLVDGGAGLPGRLDHVAALEGKVPPARISGAWPCTWHLRSAGAVGVSTT